MILIKEVMWKLILCVSKLAFEIKYPLKCLALVLSKTEQ